MNRTIVYTGGFPRLIGLIFTMGMCALFVYFGNNMRAGYSEVQSTFTRVSGTVTTYDVAPRSSSSSPSYRAKVAYTVNGTDYTVTSDATSSTRPIVGSRVNVFYDPERPGNAVVESAQNWLLPIGMMAAGILLGLLCVMGMMKTVLGMIFGR